MLFLRLPHHVPHIGLVHSDNKLKNAWVDGEFHPTLDYFLVPPMPPLFLLIVVRITWIINRG